jgi:hypothetical protein
MLRRLQAPTFGKKLTPVLIYSSKIRSSSAFCLA